MTTWQLGGCSTHLSGCVAIKFSGKGTMLSSWDRRRKLACMQTEPSSMMYKSFAESPWAKTISPSANLTSCTMDMPELSHPLKELWMLIARLCRISGMSELWEAH